MDSVSLFISKLFNYLLWLFRKFTILLRIIWLLFPAVLFFAFGVFAFWDISQGKDVLVSTLERKWPAGIVLLATIFWAMVNWYSGRILIYHRNDLYKGSALFANHVPRILGYLSFSVVWVGLTKVPEINDPTFHVGGNFWIWVLLTVSMYPLLGFLFSWFKRKYLNGEGNAKKMELVRKKVRSFNWIIGWTIIAVILLNFFNSWFPRFRGWILFFSIIFIQCGFQFLVAIRRAGMPYADGKDRPIMPLDYKTLDEWRRAESKNANTVINNVWHKILYNANIPLEEKWFFVTYNIISIISIVVYIMAVFSYDWAVGLGSLPTVLLAFGVLVGLFCIITFFSIISKINFHMVILILILLTGRFFPDPHYVVTKKTEGVNTVKYDERMALKDYFLKWVSQRRSEIEKDTAYPILFVLADGGASRSGYWTAETLGKLEDDTKGKFSNHLFCLSGASGGSVGNGTFMTLLRYKDSSANGKISFTAEAQRFLKSDFLSYTLAHMLGPDFVRPMFGRLNIEDRAAALEYAMEQGEDKDALLYQKLSKPFSTIIQRANDSITLPIICINVTRVQDGNPSVISNIKLDQQVFGKRVDVLTKVDSGYEIKLSTAMAMGARFPYISPAGKLGDSYFVDGGYFDNSGAGVVHEMIQELQRLIRDSLNADPKHYLGNLSFYVIHSQNGTGSPALNTIPPFKNDLAAPVLTLVGAFGTQTSVNDWRLIKYLKKIHTDREHSENIKDTGYYAIDLYAGLPPGTEFPMNWAISKYSINRMNEQLNNNNQLKELLTMLNARLK